MKNEIKVLILGAGVYQVPLIIEAKKRGYHTAVASIQGDYPGFALADEVYYVNTIDKDAILNIAEKEGINAITTTGTDVAIISIGYVNSHRHLNGISYSSARFLTDKALMKEAFIKGGVTTAPFFRISTYLEAVEASEMLGFPVVLKIVDKSGSRGITIIENRDQLRDIYECAKSLTDSNYMVVEKFVKGNEIGIDAIVQNGKLVMLMPHGKYMYKTDRNSIPLGHYCPMTCSEKLYSNIINETKKIIKATGLDNCAINIDAFVLPNDSLSVIEAAGRCGATGIPEVISGYTGINYYGFLLDIALGINVPEMEVKEGIPTASILLYSSQGGIMEELRYKYNGKEYINEKLNIKDLVKVDIDINQGKIIRPFCNGTDRIGMAVISSETVESLQKDVMDFRNSVVVKLF